MSKISKATCALAAALTIAPLTIAAGSTSANAEPTGKYDYVCQIANGTTYSWNNQAILACHGWLSVYINGRKIGSYQPDLIPRGKAITQQQFYCGASVAGTVVSVLSPGVGHIGWKLASVGLSAIGLHGSC